MLVATKLHTVEMLLRRSFWRPLRQTMEIFHVLPLTAALITLFALATDAQIREIYVSYLEELSFPQPTFAAYISIVAAWTAAAVGLTLISAVLYIAHYRLSTMRINVVSLSRSYADTDAMLRNLQRLAGLGLALLPWMGVAAGIWRAKSYIADRYYQLRDVARVEPTTLEVMQHIPPAGKWTIALTVIVLGVALTTFLDTNRREPALKITLVAIGPVAAAALFVLLTDSGPPTAPVPAINPVWVIAGALALISYCGDYWLETTQSHFISAPWFRRDTGINLRRRRRRWLLAWASFPWIVMAFYFAVGPLPAGAIDVHGLSLPWPSVSRWALFPIAMAWTAAAGIAVALALNRFRETAAMPIIVALGVVAFLALAIAASFWNLDAIVAFYRVIGPIGATTFTLLFTISALAVLALLSQRSGFPALGLIVLATVITVIFPVSLTISVAVLAAICGFFAVAALLARLWAVAIVAALLTFPGLLTLQELQALDPVERNPKPAETVREQFECWLDAKGRSAAEPGTDRCPSQVAKAPSRAQPPAGTAPYPVFIIAVEGGGIYAASAASLFLARLEDHLPGFAEHVFAISGVSGGSIGATVFHALTQQRPRSTGGPTLQLADSPPQHCMQHPTPAAPWSLSTQVCAVMQDDHFSPIVAAIFPEFLGTSMGRAGTLAASFISSVQSQNSTAGQALRNPFATHWQPQSTVPALVLNSTWVETGFRAAFAPFALHEVDDSLYSFDDQGMPAERDRSLMFAAIVSARFPGILPPFSVAIPNAEGTQRWNFVDGAYADNSGASTALSMYIALNDIAERHNADIRIILLTSANPQPDLANISGTLFRDTLAPIDAVLKVREGLGAEAVARACTYFYPTAATKNDSDRNAMCRSRIRDPNARLWMVEIEDQTYGLPLGWKLSRTTFEIVSWMLGDFDSCAGSRDAKPGGALALDDDAAEGLSQAGTRQLNEETLIHNSCVLRAVSNLISNGP